MYGLRQEVKKCFSMIVVYVFNGGWGRGTKGLDSEDY